jgi:DNA primase catalytic core
MRWVHGSGGGVIAEDVVRRVKEETDLVGLFAERTKVQKSGQDHVACCPFHQERTPSLHIYQDEGRFYCFGCKEKGDAIDLVRKLDSLEFDQAVESLARRAGIEVTRTGGARAERNADDRARRLGVMAWAESWFAAQLLAAEPARAYLFGRGFTPGTLEAFGIGWAPGYGRMMEAALAAGHDRQDLIDLDLVQERDGKLLDRFFGRITIPLRDRRGQCVAFQCRLLPDAERQARDAGRQVAKYVNSRETPLFSKGEYLFNLAGAQLGRKAGRCFVVEGPLDVLASQQAGVPEVVATLGTAFTPAHADALLRALGPDAKLTIALDGDAAGQAATLSAVRVCLAAGLTPHVGVLAGGKDAGQILQDGGILRDSWESIASVDALRYLLTAHPAPADAQARLRVLDDLLAIAATLPDQRLVELSWLQLISDHLAVPLKLVRQTRKPAKSAGDAAPAAQVEGVSPYGSMIGRLHRFVDATGAKPDAMCGWITADDLPADLSDSDVQMRFAHQERMQGQPLVDMELRQGSSVIFGEYRQARRDVLLQRIVGRPSTDAGREAMRNWLIGATGECRPLDLAVMCHFVYQVKCLAVGKSPEWPIIPVLFGKQEVGKSTSVEKLCAPLAELSFPIDATAITDERKSLVITRALVGRLEEMAGMARADQEKLKAMATANRAMFRELYSMSLQQRRRTCSFIASSNAALDTIITDTTGNRRFYQIDCTSKDWDVMNALDPLLVWQCASETDDAPIRDFKNLLKDDQAKLIHQDVVALWLLHDDWQALRIRRGDHDEPLLIGPYSPEVGYALEDLTARLRFWAAGSAQAVPPLPRVIQRLHQQELTRRKVTMPGGLRAHRWFLPTRYVGADRCAPDRHVPDEPPPPPPRPRGSGHPDFP